MTAVPIEAVAHTLPDVADAGVGHRIQERRTKLGMTVKDLAERSGVDRGRIAKIEGGAPARTSTIGAIEAALDQLERDVAQPPDDVARVTSEIVLPNGVRVTFIGSPEAAAEAAKRFTSDDD